MAMVFQVEPTALHAQLDQQRATQPAFRSGNRVADTAQDSFTGNLDADASNF